MDVRPLSNGRRKRGRQKVSCRIHQKRCSSAEIRNGLQHLVRLQGGRTDDRAHRRHFFETVQRSKDLRRKNRLLRGGRRLVQQGKSLRNERKTFPERPGGSERTYNSLRGRAGIVACLFLDDVRSGRADQSRLRSGERLLHVPLRIEIQQGSESGDKDQDHDRRGEVLQARLQLFQLLAPGTRASLFRGAEHRSQHARNGSLARHGKGACPGHPPKHHDGYKPQPVVA